MDMETIAYIRGVLTYMKEMPVRGVKRPTYIADMTPEEIFCRPLIAWIKVIFETYYGATHAMILFNLSFPSI